MPKIPSTFPIVFEDQDLVVINKPAGVVVNQASTVSEPTIQSWFAQYLSAQTAAQPSPLASASPVVSIPPKATWQALLPADFQPQYGSAEEIFQQRQGIVHRLDKDTSGVLLLAKNPGSLINLLDQFKTRKVSKNYQCLVHGKIKLAEAMIDAPIARAKKNRLKFAIDVTGRSAQTYYRLLQNYDFAWQKPNWQALLTPAQVKLLKKNRAMYEAGFSLVDCYPMTGRTHQIRLHLKHIGYPLVGDHTYTGKKRAKIDSLWCPRQFLHAASIKFVHPRTQQQLHLTAPLAPDLQQVLTLLIQTKTVP